MIFDSWIIFINHLLGGLKVSELIFILKTYLEPRFVIVPCFSNHLLIWLTWEYIKLGYHAAEVWHQYYRGVALILRRYGTFSFFSIIMIPLHGLNCVCLGFGNFVSWTTFGGIWLIICLNVIFFIICALGLIWNQSHCNIWKV